MAAPQTTLTLTEFLTHHDVPFRTGGSHHHVSAAWIGVDCPQCSPGSGRFRCGLHPEWLVATCWSCGKLRLGDVLAELTGLHPAECRRQLGRADRIVEERPRGQLVLPPHGPLLHRHRDYLTGRGFNVPELERLWDLKGIAYHPRLAWRVLIPIRRRGKTTSWTTRATVDQGRRYVAAGAEEEAWPAKQTLYGAEYARHGVVIVEGPADAWRVGPGAVALLGVSYTRAQVTQLAAFPVRALVFDSDLDAQKRAEQLCHELQAFPGTTENVLLDSSDPGSASPKEIRRLRRLYLESRR